MVRQFVRLKILNSCCPYFYGVSFITRNRGGGIEEIVKQDQVAPLIIY